MFICMHKDTEVGMFMHALKLFHFSQCFDSTWLQNPLIMLLKLIISFLKLVNLYFLVRNSVWLCLWVKKKKQRTWEDTYPVSLIWYCRISSYSSNFICPSYCSFLFLQLLPTFIIMNNCRLKIYLL